MGTLSIPPALVTEDTVENAVDVSIDLPPLTNRAAAQCFFHIADDLKAAIAAPLVDRLSDQGLEVSVDLSDVELNNSFSDAIAAADPRAIGDASISGEKDTSPLRAFKVTVNVNQAKPHLFGRLLMPAS